MRFVRLLAGFFELDCNVMDSELLGEKLIDLLKKGTGIGGGADAEVNTECFFAA